VQDAFFHFFSMLLNGAYASNLKLGGNLEFSWYSYNILRYCSNRCIVWFFIPANCPAQASRKFPVQLYVKIQILFEPPFRICKWANHLSFLVMKNTRKKAEHTSVTSGDFRWLPVTWLTSLLVAPHRSPTNANWAVPIYYSYKCQWVTSSYNCYIYIYIYIYPTVTSARSCNKVGHLFWFTILAQHETNDVTLYIHSVHKHRGNSFQRQNYKMRLKQRCLNWIKFHAS
jgi:hypothetical protein